jgi:hypothetical protein
MKNINIFDRQRIFARMRGQQLYYIKQEVQAILENKLILRPPPQDAATNNQVTIPSQYPNIDKFSTVKMPSIPKKCQCL